MDINHNSQWGDTGRIVVTITKPDGSQLKDEVEFEVLPPLEERTRKEKGYIPPFEIIPINPEDHAERFLRSLKRHSEILDWKTPIQIGIRNRFERYCSALSQEARCQ